MGLVGKLRERLLLFRHRENPYESIELREYFARVYRIQIGLYSYGCFDRWRIPPGTIIGRYCSVASSARILDANHPIEALSTHPYFYDPRFGVVDAHKTQATHAVIEDGVWLSHNVTITPGCARIGRGAIIGAGSIVTKDVPPYAIVGGAPAKVLRYRFDPTTIAAVEDSRWWELDRQGLSQLVRDRPDFVFAPKAGM